MSNTRDHAIDFHLPPPRFVDVGHSELAYWRVGRGPDLVLVHGWPLHSATFRGVLPYLTPHFTCHLLDLPGAGQTRERRDAPIELRAHGETMLTAIDALGIDRYALLAHDSGGLVARLVAARHQGRITALIMGNTEIPRHHSPLLKFMLLALNSALGKSMFAQVLERRWLRRSAIGFGGCFADPSLLDGEFHELFVAPLLEASNGRKLLVRQLRLLKNLDWTLIDDLEAVHRSIRAPVQLIWGHDDPFFPLDKARAMPAQFAGPSELEVLRPGKLFVHEERPAEFAALALAFAEKHGVIATQSKPERDIDDSDLVGGSASVAR